jgi:2-polyprenyl-3-methyl-5-hydroxy-6-metoxy-1,4-benzoquinol methylase
MYQKRKKITVVKTAKDILLGHDFFAQRQLTEKYIHHEFQDYAYRLASDLGDLKHKAIYMHLAKTVPRHILARALAFTGDYKDINKGKLFMWKLKQLREEAQLLIDNQKLDYDSIWQRTGKLYDQLASALMQKYVKTADELNPLLTLAVAKLAAQKPKALVLDSLGGYIPEMLTAVGFKVESLEISKQLTELIKVKYKTLKLRRSQFTIGKYKPNSFDMLWCQSFWSLVPLELESQFITEFARLVKPAGLLQTKLTIAETASQEWEMFTLSENNYYRFNKLSNTLILKQFEQYFTLLDKTEDSYLFRKIT